MDQEPMLLYLCSSNIRPLYVQDILDIVGAPTGVPYRFRYERRYVNGAARGPWERNEMVNTEVLVHFTLQQEARYHDPVLFPIRRGQVVRSWKEGTAYFVEFRLGRLVSLPAWPSIGENALDQGDQGSRKREAYEIPPKEYGQRLRDNGIDLPYDSPASLGKDVTRDASTLDDTSDEELLFERTTHYLTRTESFRQAWFLRCLRIVPRSDSADQAIPFSEQAQAFELDGGRAYTIQVSQRQPRDVRQAQRFRVDTDENIVRLVGMNELEIASRYDRLPIVLDAIEPPAGVTRETVVVISPASQSIQGPRIRIPIRVRPSVGEAAVGVVTTMGLVLVAILAQTKPVGIAWTTLTIAAIAASQVAVRTPWFVRSLRRLLAR